MDPHEQEVILREIKHWQTEGILPPETCQRLLDYYLKPAPQPPFQEIAAGKAAQAPSAPSAPAPRRSLGQLLLSETAVNTALYLGGFFIIAAAFIIAALVAAIRLPILVTATLIFLGSSLFILRRLRQVSIVLFLIGSLFIPIDAQVVSGMFELTGRSIFQYWAFVSLLAGLIWLVGYILFHNWILSSLTFLAVTATVYLTTLWLVSSRECRVLALSLVMLFSLLVAGRLGRRYGNSLKLPLLFLSQIGEFILICWLLYLLIPDHQTPASWVLQASGWLLAASYYAFSDWVVRLSRSLSPFPFAAVFCFGIFPLIFLVAFSPSAVQVAWLAFAWGLLFTLAAEWLVKRVDRPVKLYRYAFFFVGGLLFLGAIITFIAEHAFLPGEIALLVSGFLYLALHLRRLRWWLWTPALLAFSLAYFNLFLTGPLEDTTFPIGFIFLLPALCFYSLDLLVFKGLLFSRNKPFDSTSGRLKYFIPPLILAVICSTIDFGLGLITSNTDQAWPAQVFLVYGLFFAVYAFIRSEPLLGVLCTGSLAIALFSALSYANVEKYLAPLLLLAGLYYLVGLGLSYLSRARRWSDVILWSGLILGSLAAGVAPLKTEPFTILGVAFIAFFYTIEGWRRRSAWYGLPACVVFYLAYLTALLLLDIHQPQYYSIAASVLGILMHWIFLRTKNPIAALIAGIFAILILLSTTFIQMVRTEELRYFLLLFFEALLLLGYGLIMRSRSFFFIPILYLVLATIVVVTTVLSGVPTAIIIGCTGLLLLGLGILALLMRDRLIKVSEKVGGRFNIW